VRLLEIFGGALQTFCVENCQMKRMQNNAYTSIHHTPPARRLRAWRQRAGWRGVPTLSMLPDSSAITITCTSLANEGYVCVNRSVLSSMGPVLVFSVLFFFYANTKRTS